LARGGAELVIDCHVHTEGGGLDPRLIRHAERLGVDRLVVSSLGSWAYEPTHEDCQQANRDLRKLTLDYPGLVLGLAYVNPCHPEAGGEFERCVAEWGFVGLKLWVACRVTDDRVRPLLAKARGLRVPVQHHAWYKITGNLPHESYPHEVARAAAQFPEVQFIMAHIGGDWLRGIAAVRHQPNISVDTSGSIVEDGMIEAAVTALGARRVLFGSDAHGGDLAVNLAKIAGARIPVRARRLILGGNFARLARLSER
jgi:predicted TIM-barrel fold metal-dependent hydrolase